jgi:hypothetical protein
LNPTEIVGFALVPWQRVVRKRHGGPGAHRRKPAAQQDALRQPPDPFSFFLQHVRDNNARLESHRELVVKHNWDFDSFGQNFPPNPQSLSVEGTNLAIFVEVDDLEGAMRRLSA